LDKLTIPLRRFKMKKLIIIFVVFVSFFAFAPQAQADTTSSCKLYESDDVILCIVKNEKVSLTFKIHYLVRKPREIPPENFDIFWHDEKERKQQFGSVGGK